MKTRSGFRLCLLLALAIPPVAAQEDALIAARQTSIHALMDTGKFTQALRLARQSREEFPAHEGLRELLAMVEDVVQRERGNDTGGESISRPPTATLPGPGSASQPVPGEAFTLGELGLTLVWIAPGEFVMASVHGNDDATPVRLTRGYWLGRTEVTQEQWRRLRGANPNPSHFRGSQRPVENITWVDAMEFARALNERERAAGRLPEGYAYSLPTEAEWEYACRAGTTGPFAGDLDALGWHRGNSGGQTQPVARLAPNAWGLHDMHGNVWEWCLDGLGEYPGRPVDDPLAGYRGFTPHIAHIIRGGSWSVGRGFCRSDQRYWRTHSTTAPGIGFRIALAPVRPGAAGD